MNVPVVKARRAIGPAWRTAAAPLRRAERAVSCAMEFMMMVDEVNDRRTRFDGLEWSLWIVAVVDVDNLGGCWLLRMMREGEKTRLGGTGN